MRNEKYLRVALSAAVSAAEVAFKTANNEINRHKGAHRDIVTQSDIDANNVILKKLAQIGHQVISEETSIPEVIPWKDGVWVVDPIDGSVNFAHGLEYFSTSVCYMKDREFIYGVVCAPSINELFFNLSPSKALLNGRVISHTHTKLENSLLAMSFPAHTNSWAYELFRVANESSRGCLRTGCASLNICWAAASKLQGAFGVSAKLWDVAGAIAIAKASGCHVHVEYSENGFEVDYIIGSKHVVESLRSLMEKIKSQK